MSKHIQHKQVYEFLHKNYVGILSTANSKGIPWGSAIYYVVDESLRIYFVTRVGTYKYKNLEEQPNVAFTVVDAENQTTVQLAGVISRVPAHDYMDIVFNKLAKLKSKHASELAPPIEKIHKGDYMPLCITPTKLQFAEFKKDYTDYDQKFIEEII